MEESTLADNKTLAPCNANKKTGNREGGSFFKQNIFDLKVWIFCVERVRKESKGIAVSNKTTS